MNNYIGIYTNPNSQHTNSYRLENTTFMGTGNLRTPYPGQLTVLGKIPYAGMDLHNVSIMSIGTTSNALSPVHFENLNNGIKAHNSNIVVANSNFVNLH